MSGWHVPQIADKRGLNEWVPGPDGIDMNLFDSAGGWIGTPAELLKIGAAIREPKSPILSNASIMATFSKPAYADIGTGGKEVKKYYGAGWDVLTNEGTNRSSVIAGTTGSAALFYYYGDGLGWVAVGNTVACADKSHFANGISKFKLDQAIQDAAKGLRR